MTNRFLWLCFSLFLSASAVEAESSLRAGAAIVSVTPETLPVLINGSMVSKTADSVKTKVNARAIVLADADTELAIVVVDSCMMGRELLDETKLMAEKRTGIPANRMLISATHTHSAPASMGCLGTNADPIYQLLLKKRLVEAIVAAQERLEPASVGFAVEDAGEFTALRRWIRRPDRMLEDPFGNKTVRANMHPGYLSDDAIGESGPEDPDLSMIAIRSRDGKRPIAVLANFSMHYFGDKAISADYFGLFCNGFQEALAEDNPDFVAVMSHGCSGDIYLRDYTKPAPAEKPTIEGYTEGLLEIALRGYRGISEYSDGGENPLEMEEARLAMRYRTPDKQRLEWAQKIVTEMGDRLPKTKPEIYAREAILLHEKQETMICTQGLRIGDIGIATTPNETYALTGLNIKAHSPLVKTMVIELANGGDGYIPPPEQHRLGGYNTWPARSAGLEVTAEPRIVQSCISLLETVADKPRRSPALPMGEATRAILDLKPIAYWRLNEMTGPIVEDASERHRNAHLTGDMAFYLAGPNSEAFSGDFTNRSTHFAGGQILSSHPEIDTDYTISLWFWNGMPLGARDVTGWLFSRERNFGGKAGDHLGIDREGNLIFENYAGRLTSKGAPSERWKWHHLILARTHHTVQVFLDGKSVLFEKQVSGYDKKSNVPFVFGRRSDRGTDNFEGRIDEVAIFDRVEESLIEALKGN